MDFISELANKNNAILVTPKVKRHLNGEFEANILNYSIKNSILMEHHLNTHDDLIELLIIARGYKTRCSGQFIVYTPYFMYSRQDKSDGGIKLILELMRCAGVDKIVTMDLHAKVSVANIELESLSPAKIFAKQLLKMKDNFLVVAPDAGAKKRAINLARKLKCPTLFLNKVRENDECIISDFNLDIEGYHCVIVDDIIESGKTICAVYHKLKAKNPLAISACITHALLCQKATEDLKVLKINKFFVCNNMGDKSGNLFESLDYIL